MQEIWKDVKGYEGCYQVSNLGRVKSLERRVCNRKSGSTRLIKEQILNVRDNGYGYLSVLLRKHGASKRFYVHRLVAEAFLPNPNNKEQVNHLDYNKTNNILTNLEWCTAKENTQYSVERMKKPKSKCNEMHRPKIRCKPTSTGYKYIGKRGELYRVHIRAIGVDKRFYTLDDAIKYRDEMVKEKKWENQSYKRTKKPASFVAETPTQIILDLKNITFTKAKEEGR